MPLFRDAVFKRALRMHFYCLNLLTAACRRRCLPPPSPPPPQAQALLLACLQAVQDLCGDAGGRDRLGARFVPLALAVLSHMRCGGGGEGRDSPAQARHLMPVRPMFV